MSETLKEVNVESNEQKNQNIIDLQKEIKKIYTETQKNIYESYFKNYLSNINKIEEIEIYKSDLIKFRDLLGAKDILIDYDEFCVNQEMKANEKNEKLRGISNKLAVINNSVIARFFRKITRIFHRKEGKSII